MNDPTPLAVTIFYAVMILGAVYFLLKRRNVDFFSIAFFGCVIYFAPGFFGTSRFLVQHRWVEANIVPQAYVVMIVVVAMLLLSAATADLTGRWHVPERVSPFAPSARSKTELLILAVAALLAFVALLVTAGDYLWLPKAEMMQGLNRWLIVMSNLSIVGFCVSIITKRRKYQILFGSLLLFDLLIGFRSSAVIAIVALFALHLHARGPIRLIQAGRSYLFWGIALLCVFLIYKGYIANIKAGEFAYILENQLNVGTVSATFTNSEPFVVVNNLNQILISDYHTTFDSFVNSIVAGIVPLSSMLGFQTSSHSFQTILFPDVDYGLASNIWGEVWSAGGWILLLAFIIGFNAVILLGNTLLPRLRGLPLVILSAMMSLWTVYIHRNTVEYQLVMERRLFLVLAIGVLASVLTKKKAYRFRGLPLEPQLSPSGPNWRLNSRESER